MKSYKWHGTLPDKKTKKASSSQPCCGVKVHIPELKSQPLNLTARIMVAGVTVLDCNSELKIGHIPVSRRGCRLPFFTPIEIFAGKTVSDAGKLSEDSVQTCADQEEYAMVVLTGCSFLGPSLCMVIQYQGS